MNKVTINTAVKIQITCMPPTYNLFRSVNPYFCRMFPQAPLLTLRGHQGAVYDLAWDTSEHSWISAGGDGVVARWSFGKTDGTALFQHASPFFAVTVWDDLVLGGNHTGELFVKTLDKHTVYTPHKAPIFALFVDAQNRLWSGDGAGVVGMWSRDGQGLRLEQQWNTSLGKIRHFSSHPQGLLMAGGSGQWCVLDETGKLQRGVQAHARSCYWALHLEAKNVVLSGGQDGQLRVQRHDESLLTLDVHQSAVYRGLIYGSTLWTCGRDKGVKAWSLDSLDALDKLKLPHTRSVNAMALGGPGGAHLATGSDDRSIKVWAL